MSFSPDTVSQDRYMTDVKATIVEWLVYHLHDGDGNEGFAEKWARIGGGVDISAGSPAVPPEDEELDKPRIGVDDSSDEINNTKMNSACGQFLTDGSFHTITLRITALCDENTGGQITADDLTSAIGVCFDKYRWELEPAGIAMLRFRATPEGESGDGLYEKVTEIVCDVQVRGSNLQTIVLEMARFTMTALSTGTYTDGHELDTASELRIKCITGFRVLDVEVTAYAKNQDGDASTLTGSIPNGASAGTLVELTPADSGDTFTDVTSIEATGGLAGEIFVIENIPQEV